MFLIDRNSFERVSWNNSMNMMVVEVFEWLIDQLSIVVDDHQWRDIPQWWDIDYERVWLKKILYSSIRMVEYDRWEERWEESTSLEKKDDTCSKRFSYENGWADLDEGFFSLILSSSLRDDKNMFKEWTIRLPLIMMI